MRKPFSGRHKEDIDQTPNVTQDNKTKERPHDEDKDLYAPAVQDIYNHSNQKDIGNSSIVNHMTQCQVLLQMDVTSITIIIVSLHVCFTLILQYTSVHFIFFFPLFFCEPS